MMGRGRTHHHVSKKRSEDLIAVDYYFLKPNSTANSQTIPDESVTIAVNEDKEHHEQRGSEEWNQRTLVARFKQLVRVQRNHVEKRQKAGNDRLQKSCN